jgi:NAD(P)-dependent dehydrogenase (short-subunit alcohol dehydrogenase family)
MNHREMGPPEPWPEPAMELKDVKDAGEIVVVTGAAGGVFWKLFHMFARRRDTRVRAIAREEVELLRVDMDKQFDMVRADLGDVPKKTLELILDAQAIRIPVKKHGEE